MPWRTCMTDKWKKSTLMKNALTLYQRDIVFKKEPRSYQTKIEDDRHWHLLFQPATVEDVDFSKRALKRPSRSSILFARSWRKRNRLSIWDIKKLVLEWREMFLQTWHGKERERQRNSIKMPGWTRQLRRNTMYPKGREKSIRKRRSSSVFQLQNGKL